MRKKLNPAQPILITDRAHIILSSPAFIQLWHQYLNNNRLHLCRWEPTRNDEYFTIENMLLRLAVMAKEQERGSAYHFWVLTPEQDKMLAQISFTNIVHGAFRACHLGYSTDEAHQGQGLMTEVLTACVDHMFQRIGLNRVMANYMPENKASARLLNKLGFKVEGKAERYLLINGKWQDHVLTSKLREEVYS